MNRPNGIPTVRGTMHPRFDEIVTPEALAFVAKLDSEFAGRRAELLQARRQNSRQITQGANLDFRADTAAIRAGVSVVVAVAVAALAPVAMAIVDEVLGAPRRASASADSSSPGLL